VGLLPMINQNHVRYQCVMIIIILLLFGAHAQDPSSILDSIYSSTEVCNLIRNDTGTSMNIFVAPKIFGKTEGAIYSVKGGVQIKNEIIHQESDGIISLLPNQFYFDNFMISNMNNLCEYLLDPRNVQETFGTCVENVWQGKFECKSEFVQVKECFENSCSSSYCCPSLYLVNYGEQRYKDFDKPDGEEKIQKNMKHTDVVNYPSEEQCSRMFRDIIRNEFNIVTYLHSTLGIMPSYFVMSKEYVFSMYGIRHCKQFSNVYAETLSKQAISFHIDEVIAIKEATNKAAKSSMSSSEDSIMMLSLLPFGFAKRFISAIM